MRIYFNYSFFKSIFDKLFAHLLIIILSPFLILIYILVFVDLGKPVIFKQLRTGKNNKPFYIYKFKTMVNSSSLVISIKNDNLRTSKLGKFLRRSSIDELPELFNIVRGEMSFVGPRPFIHSYLDKYSKYHIKRHNVLPGITGLAQIKGRNLITWKEKLDTDILYLNKYNFIGDLVILLKTFLLKRRKKLVKNRKCS